MKHPTTKQYLWKQPTVLLAAGAVILGLIGLSGWLFNSFALRSFLSDGATMKVNTALIIICCGVSMVALNVSKSKAGCIFLAIGALICIITLLQYLFRSNWGIDQLFFKDTDTNPLLESPGRPSVLTSANGLLICIALFAGNIRFYKTSQWLSTISFFVIYTALMGHLFGVSNFYRWGHYSGIAFNTALSFALLNLSVLFYQSSYGWIALFFIKVRGRLSISYFIAYLLLVLPIIVTLYVFLINKAGISTISATILIVIMLVVISIPIFYIFLSQINIIGSDLSRATQRLEIALNAGKFGSYDVDLDSGLMICSDQCKANFGLPMDSVFNFPNLMDAIVPQHRDYVSAQVQNAIAKQQLYQAEYQVQWPDGTLHWINASGLPQYNDKGIATSIIGVTYDITEIKENDLRKNAFIGMVSHELKTPLTSMKSYIQVLNKMAVKKGEVFESNALDMAERQVIKMTKMINGFLDVSRLESGQIYLDKSRFELDKLILEVVTEASLIFPSHEIVMDLEDNIRIEADYDKIGQVINNLVSNAVKYAPNEKLIQISCAIINGAAVVRVKDKGIGIAQKYFAHIFDRFYRIEEVSRQNISGFGIGLYLSAEIVRLHGGKIMVESEEGAGSTFSFTLPLLGL